MSYNSAPHQQSNTASATDTHCDDDSTLTSNLPVGAQVAVVSVLPGTENGLSAATNLHADTSADGGTTNLAIGGKFGTLFAGGAGTSASFGPDGADASVQVAFAADAPGGTTPAWGSAGIGIPSAETGVQAAFASDAPAGAAAADGGVSFALPSADTGVQVALAADAPDLGIAGSDCGMLEGGPLSLGLFGSDPVSLSGLDIPALDICSLDQTA